MDSTRPGALPLGQTRARRFSGGILRLVDTSSNGTYVNGAQVPLGKFHDYALKDGDYIRLGEYELLVSIDKSNDFPPMRSAGRRLRRRYAVLAVKKSTANDSARIWI
jgi:pSer/pThr/pTyr-binding forkhead associated (FHA) protein